MTRLEPVNLERLQSRVSLLVLFLWLDYLLPLAAFLFTRFVLPFGHPTAAIVRPQGFLQQ